MKAAEAEVARLTAELAETLTRSSQDEDTHTALKVSWRLKAESRVESRVRFLCRIVRGSQVGVRGDGTPERARRLHVSFEREESA